MNAERLLQHFERISEASDAIPRLRQFILDLAVCGQLVPQDPNDEPAAELLKRIQVEKDRLANGRLIKRLRATSLIDASEVPCPLPATWEWVRIGDLLLGDSQNGYSKKPDDAVNGIPILRISAGTVRKDGIVAEEEHKLIGGVQPSQQEQYKLQPGDLLACRFNGNRSFVGRLSLYLGYLGINPIYPDKLIRLRLLSKFVLPKLVRCFAESSVVRRGIEGYCATTVGNWGISASNLKEVKIPLPPLAEQYRIVAKVDELMALCDQLEAAKTEREQSRDRLVAASLHRLNSPADTAETDAPDLLARQADAFRDHASFVFNNLPRLTTRPEHIKQLRQTILNLAVRGKLVPQDPNDEPVSELVRRVAAERQGLLAKGWLKAQKSYVAVDADPPSQPIPATWEWTRLADLISFGPQNGISPKPTNNTESPKALTLTATTSGAFDAGQYKHVDLREVDCQNYWLSMGDVLFQRGNTREYVGIAAVFDGPEKSFVFPDLMIRVRFAESLSIRFIHMTLISPPLRRYFSVEATGASSSMPKISQGVLLNAPIPLPPLAEQHRIVARVDELMALCDQLEAQLIATEADSRRLLEAVLHEALHPPLAATEQMKSEANT